MSPRIAVELTSERPDGTWTWRAAGARQPKGVLDGKLLPAGTGVGDIVRAEAEFDIDGITVTTVLAPKGSRPEPDRLEVLGSQRDDAPVTTSRPGRDREGPRPIDRSDRPERPKRSGGGAGPHGRPDRSRPERGRGDAAPSLRPRPGRVRPDGDARAGDGTPDGRRERRPRPPRPEAPPRPKPKRLRPRRVHRDALLATLPPEQHPIAEQALKGGMPAVRAALDEQNAGARREGKPEAPTAAVLAIAEALLPKIRVAEWLDRADAALADVEELALADLRSVVTSAGDVARDGQTIEPAATLRAVLERRSEEEQGVWQRDLEQSLQSGRVVRALRLSSRSPQPGEHLAPEVATRLSEAAGAAMTADIAVDRWATLLDAVAYSAVRRSVTPAGVPAEPSEELLAQVRKHARRVPAIAGLFGIDAPTPPTGRRPARRRPPAARTAEDQGPQSRSPGPLGAAQGGPPRPRRIPPPPASPADTMPASTPPAEPAPASTPAPEPAAASTDTTPSSPSGDIAPPPAPDDASRPSPSGDTVAPSVADASVGESRPESGVS